MSDYRGNKEKKKTKVIKGYREKVYTKSNGFIRYMRFYENLIHRMQDDVATLIKFQI